MNQLAGVLMAQLLQAAQYILKRKQCLMTKFIQLITDLNQDLMFKRKNTNLQFYT